MLHEADEDAITRLPPAGMPMPELFSVNQLAEALGVTPRAIRFYEAKGLLAPKRAGTMRVFDRRDRARLLLVLRGKRLGFTLAEIRENLDLYDSDRSQHGQVSRLLARTRERITELEQQHRDVTQTLGELRDIERQADAALTGLGAADGKHGKGAGT